MEAGLCHLAVHHYICLCSLFDHDPDFFSWIPIFCWSDPDFSFQLSGRSGLWRTASFIYSDNYSHSKIEGAKAEIDSLYKSNTRRPIMCWCTDRRTFWTNKVFHTSWGIVLRHALHQHLYIYTLHKGLRNMCSYNNLCQYPFTSWIFKIG